MQLKNISARMSLATCTLLQVASPSAQGQETTWDIDTATLFYSEGDGRVSAFEPAIYAGRELTDDERIDLRLVVDVLTGASPNGAHASPVAQTFTTPSGKRTYISQPGEMPLDETFRDTRVAFGVDWEMGLDRLSRLTLGANFSKEYDYLSLGGSATYARDFNNRNTTLTSAIAFNMDVIEPEGNIPSALQPMVAEGFAANRDSADEDKSITDFMLGVTQVISRRTLMQLNLSFGQTDGYQNDPFKIVSVIDPATGLPATGSFFDTASSGNLPYLYESRPDSRDRTVLFFKTVHHLEEDVIHFSYRYYDDDWGINSNTFDLRYRYELEDSYLQPHVRFYSQDAADFYRHNLKLGTDVDAVSGQASINYASHDYRLAKSETTTVGLKYGIPLAKNSEFSVRGEVIRQTVDDGPVPAGEETPDLDAFVLQLSYSLVW